MSSKQVVRVAREIPVAFVILFWLLLMSWRFFTGAHMNGERYFDTLWFKDATPGYKRRQVAFSAWKRKARIKRMGWRNCVFWPIAGITYGCLVAPDTMVILAFWMAPIYGYLGFVWIRKTFFELHRAGYAEGQIEEFWKLKRQYRWMRFEWLHSEPSVTVKKTEDAEHEDIHIISLKTLMNPGDDDEWTKGGDA